MRRLFGSRLYELHPAKNVLKVMHVMRLHDNLRLSYPPFIGLIFWMGAEVSSSFIVLWIFSCWTLEFLLRAFRHRLIAAPDNPRLVLLFGVHTICACTSWSALPFFAMLNGGYPALAGLALLFGILVTAWMYLIWLPAIACVANAVPVLAMVAPSAIRLIHEKDFLAQISLLTILTLVLGSYLPMFQHWVTKERQEETLRMALEKAKSDAEQEARSKAEFLAYMSHEVRAPLAGIILSAKLLLKHRDDFARWETAADRLSAGGEILLNLLNGVLDYSKLQAGKATLNLAPSNLADQISKILKILSPVAEAEGIELAAEYSPDFPQLIELDLDRVSQVSINLIHNAIKYAGGGRVLILAHHEASTLEVRVVDFGSGIPTALNQTLFTPYERLEVEKSRSSGTGLGLSIASSLVGLMKGELGYEATPGGGTTFWFKVPAPALA